MYLPSVISVLKGLRCWVGDELMEGRQWGDVGKSTNKGKEYQEEEVETQSPYLHLGCLYELNITTVMAQVVIMQSTRILGVIET